MKRRLQVLQEGCRKLKPFTIEKYINLRENNEKDFVPFSVEYDKTPGNTNQDSTNKETMPVFLYDMHHRVLLRTTPKTGSTTWKLAMLNNTGNIHISLEPGQKFRQAHLSTLREFGQIITTENRSVTELVHLINTSFTIVTVRHPFDRLESAYVDKVLINNAHKIRQRIWKARGNIERSEGNLNRERSSYVSFEMYLNYVLNHSNVHWCSIYKAAKPCDIPYRLEIFIYLPVFNTSVKTCKNVYLLICKGLCIL